MKELTPNEIEFINLIRNSDNPEEALIIAAEIIAHLEECDADECNE